MIQLAFVVVGGLMVRSGMLSVRELMPYLTLGAAVFLVAPGAAGWLIPWIGIHRSGLRCPQCQRYWISPGGIALPLQSGCGRCGYQLVPRIAEHGVTAPPTRD